MKSLTTFICLLATASHAAFSDGWSLWSPRNEAKPDVFGTVATAEVDLNAPTHWNSLGDFKAQIQSHRPPALKE